MRRLRFIVPSGALNEREGARVVLPEEEGRHFRVTLRGRAGEEVHLFDGAGSEWRARVETIEGNAVVVRLVSPEASPVEPPLRSEVFQAVSRGDAFDAAVAELTSLGVSAIVPLLVERRAVPAPPDAKRVARWRRIAREAAKLSWRRVVPEIGEPLTVSRLPGIERPEMAGLLLDVDASAGSLRAALAEPPPRVARLVVGPEGGFTQKEREILGKGPYRPVRLGPRVLRTEHAGAAALAIVLAAWGDMA